MIKITKAQNGAILEIDGESMVHEFNVNTSGVSEEVVRENTKGFIEMINQVAEALGHSYDGFSKYNLRISFDEWGDEVEELSEDTTDNSDIVEQILDDKNDK